MALNPPLGTGDPKIFLENVKRLDELINGPAANVMDRGGELLESWRAIRQNLVPLSRQYANLAAAQADIANIPDGSVTYIRSDSDDTLANEYMNNGGVLEATGKRMPSQSLIDQVAKISERVVFDGSEDVYFSFVDSDGNIVGRVCRNGESGAIEFKGHEIVDSVVNGLHIVTPNGEIMASIVNGEFISSGGFSQKGYTVSQSDDFSFLISDPEGNVVFAIDHSGRLLNAINNEPGGNTESAIIAEASVRSALAGVSANTFRTSIRERPRKKLNIFLIYGQSYSIGSDSEMVVSDQQYFGNLTLGTLPRGQHTGSGSAPYSFDPVGGNVLYPLIESGSESPVSGLINSLKWLHNEKMGVENDEEHIFAGVTAGVSAVDIAGLSEGFDPERYNRLRTAISGFKEAADSAGYDACISGLVYIQGENDVNNGNSYEYYYNALENLFGEINATIKEYFPNNKDVDVFLGQIGGRYIVDRKMEIPRAQMDFCDNHDWAHFLGTYSMYPCPEANLHLLSNSYRWFHCNTAKVVHKVLNGYDHTTFRINSVKHKENEIWVGFNVPFPPLKFRAGYIRKLQTLYDDKGFTVVDESGVLKGADLNVEIIADTVIKITCPRNLNGAVAVALGDQDHMGRHNVSDSDPSVSMFTWDVKNNTQASGYIPELNNVNYPLFNWAGIDSVKSVEA